MSRLAYSKSCRLLLGCFAIVVAAWTQVGRAAPQPEFKVGSAVDLIPGIEVSRDSVGLPWKLEGHELISPKQPDALLKIAAKPPKCYRLTIIGQRDGGDDLFIVPVVDGHQVTVLIDGAGRSATALSTIDGKLGERRDYHNVLGDNRDYTVVCTVFPRNLVVTVNGTPVVTWTGDPKAFALPKHWQLPASECMFVGGFNAAHHIRTLTLEALGDGESANDLLRKDHIYKLVFAQPTEPPKVGWDWFAANHAPTPSLWPFAMGPEVRTCREYIFAHAPSKVIYELAKAGPRVEQRFTAVGYCPSRSLVRYRVFASDSPSFTGKTNQPMTRLFESEPCRIAKIDVPIAAKERYLMLQIDDNGDRDNARSFWLHPIVHRDRQEFHLAGLRGGVPPTKVEVTNEELFKVDRVPSWACEPLDIDDETRCDEFLYAHARSEATYEIPEDAERFSAIGYCLQSQTASFRLRFDNHPDPVYSGSPAGIDRINVKIPPGAKEITLLVDPAGHYANDYSFWLYPRFHLAHDKPAAKKRPSRTKK